MADITQLGTAERRSFVIGAQRHTVSLSADLQLKFSVIADDAIKGRITEVECGLRVTRAVFGDELSKVDYKDAQGAANFASGLFVEMMAEKKDPKGATEDESKNTKAPQPSGSGS